MKPSQTVLEAVCNALADRYPDCGPLLYPLNRAIAVALVDPGLVKHADAVLVRRAAACVLQGKDPFREPWAQDEPVQVILTEAEGKGNESKK